MTQSASRQNRERERERETSLQVHSEMQYIYQQRIHDPLDIFLAADELLPSQQISRVNM